MPSKTPAPSPPRRPATSREHGEGRRFQGLVRRLRDLLIMAIVGPVTGVLAIVAIHFATALHPGALDPVARSADGERALALLEDRPVGTAALPRGVVPFDPDARTPPPAPAALQAADFRGVKPTADARRMADWVVERRDNGTLPFMVLDKRDARLYVFEPGGHLVDDTPVLLGSARGDDTYPGIGEVPIAQVKPYQRTTAAGRFVTQPGLDADRTDVVWLDYDAALAMHRVIDKVKSERRLQRIASPDPRVRRISWGCINVPVDFFDRRISPVFGKHAGVTYVIPETRSFARVFEQAGARRPAAATLDIAALAPKDVANR